MTIERSVDIDRAALKVLRDTFGYTEFRGHQAAIVRHTTSGGDSFVLMPTGSGKSLCFQVPAMLRPGVAIVVSPLIALMEDQVAALRENGVRAAMLNSSVSSASQAAITRQIVEGSLDLVYIAPERLLTDQTIALLKAARIALFAIDEAHCVSRWGHDFRPEYLGLSALHEIFPDVPRIALTATADEKTRQEIIDQLNLHDAATFVAGFDRPNIRYQIKLRDGAGHQLLDFLADNHPTDSGIVYCLSRKKTETVAQMLTKAGRTALPYHAGMDADSRRSNQSRFLREDGLIIVATIAFGMGIDKPDVRFVAHLDLPRSIEAYYQETGRAGRDGLPANAWMAYGTVDAVTYRGFIDQSDASEDFKQLERAKLQSLINLCETSRCRRQVLLEYFGDTLPMPCGNCDNCLNPVNVWDASLAARKAIFIARATDQRFGTKHLIDILIGQSNDRIVRFGHDKLSGFGRGTELTDKEWNSVFRQLVAYGYLSVDTERYGSIKLTDLSARVLDKTETVYLRKDPPKEKRRRKGAEKLTTETNLDQQEAQLFEQLRIRRRELALEHGVPPYVIFSDSTLKSIAKVRPQTLAQFHQISGVGEQKLRSYGQIFLDVIHG